MSKVWRDAFGAAVYALFVGGLAVGVAHSLPVSALLKLGVAAGIAIFGGIVSDPVVDIARILWAGWRCGKSGRR